MTLYFGHALCVRECRYGVRTTITCVGAVLSIYVFISVVLLRPTLPLRVSPSWGIVRKVALILLRLGPTNVQLGVGGADEIFGTVVGSMMINFE